MAEGSRELQMWLGANVSEGYRAAVSAVAATLLRKTHGGRDGLRVLPRDVRFVFGLVRDGRSGPIDEPPERRVGHVSALSRAVEGRPARGDAHVAVPGPDETPPPTSKWRVSKRAQVV